MEIDIKPLSEENLEQALALETACFSDPWSKAMLLPEISNLNACFLIALVGKTAAGYGGIYWAADEASIARLCVLPAFRRNHIGKALIEALLRQAKKKGAVKTFLEVRKSNLPAISLYQSVGFSRLGERNRYYPDNLEDAVIMVKEG